MITPPKPEELKAAKSLLWALDSEPRQLAQEIGQLELVALSTLLQLQGRQRYETLQRVPQFLWAFNMLDNHGIDRLRAAVEKYSEIAEQA